MAAERDGRCSYGHEPGAEDFAGHLFPNAEAIGINLGGIEGKPVAAAKLLRADADRANAGQTGGMRC